MAITTEMLLCHPRCFGLTTASPLQRAICRAADGIPLADLADHPDVLEAFGGAEAVATLPNEPPKEFFLIAAIRGGKSLFSAALSLKIALTIDMSLHMKPSDIGRISIVAIDRDKAGAIMEHLMGALTMEGGALGRFLMPTPKPNTESVYIRRDDGRKVRIVVAAGRRAGGSLVSRWTLAAVLDEACRMSSAKTGAVVSFEESRKAVIKRISVLKGAQFVVVSSPHAASGPVYDRVQTYRASPSPALVLVQATGPMLNPSLWTPEECEKARLAAALGGDDEASYLTDVLGRFCDVEAGWLLSSDVDSHTRTTPLTLPRAPEWLYVAAMDPGLRGNSWTLVIVGFRHGDGGEAVADQYAVARCWLRTGSRTDPLDARKTLTEIRDELKPYGLSEVWTDGYGAEFIKQMGADLRLDVKEDDETTSVKDERPIDFRQKLVAGKVELSPEPVLRADLLAARVRRTANATKLDLPLTRDGRHCDYVPALLLAMAKAANGPSNLERITAWRRKHGGVLVV